jgi:poly-gamma-glutamate synthesis protein (capsule biosynthesis protein)
MNCHRFFFGLIAVGLLVSACTPAQPGDSQPAQVAEPEATEIPAPLSLWLPPYLPSQLTQDLRLPDGIIFSSGEQNASVKIDVGSDALVSQWVYALVAPFPTVTDEVSSSSLKAFWQGSEIKNFPLEKLLVDGKTKALFEKLWGIASVRNVTVTAEEELLATAWDAKNTWAVIPFESLEPRWKVLRIDGQSPIRKGFNSLNYPLTIPFSAVGNASDVSRFLEINESPANPLFPLSNRDEQKMATVMLTGVTALVRATAYKMETNGMTYPAIDIGDLLRSADILHISNEIPFTDTCPNPFYNRTNEANLVFCSKPEYIQLLEAVGTDVVELTGDHFRDWGPDAMLNTIAMYDERGWQYYGGGKNLDDAMSPALFEINGNKIAFLGCNAKPPGYATAKANYPGALHCDMEAMANEIAAVIKKGYQPIFTFQHLEYYAYNINRNLVNDFHKAAEAGAVVISGSQAHQPHAFEFYKGAILHYGLGNLFFDQYNESAAQQQAFIDEHIFYDGRYISTELVTIQFIDNARSRFSTNAEREELLQKVFSASKW